MKSKYWVLLFLCGLAVPLLLKVAAFGFEQLGNAFVRYGDANSYDVAIWLYYRAVDIENLKVMRSSRSAKFSMKQRIQSKIELLETKRLECKGKETK